MLFDAGGLEVTVAHVNCMRLKRATCPGAIRACPPVDPAATNQVVSTCIPAGRRLDFLEPATSDQTVQSLPAS
jgi:hypothetical protein